MKSKITYSESIQIQNIIQRIIEDEGEKLKSGELYKLTDKTISFIHQLIEDKKQDPE